ncbi:hypothetical protein MKZ38_002138 [Zalerion maritima]|uniref:Uncharacterized protein n=1 Tax=Zalerion maritima TaxID=339359 RepID=A0AAD5RR26_9PEZI|nr:hypothetical protein MKZ38_002138 [Zalerion maritima]
MKMGMATAKPETARILYTLIWETPSLGATQDVIMVPSQLPYRPSLVLAPTPHRRDPLIQDCEVLENLQLSDGTTLCETLDNPHASEPMLGFNDTESAWRSASCPRRQERTAPCKTSWSNVRCISKGDNANSHLMPPPAAL